jgi:hypothetical protein
MAQEWDIEALVAGLTYRCICRNPRCDELRALLLQCLPADHPWRRGTEGCHPIEFRVNAPMDPKTACLRYSVRHHLCHGDPLDGKVVYWVVLLHWPPWFVGHGRVWLIPFNNRKDARAADVEHCFSRPLFEDNVNLMKTILQTLGYDDTVQNDFEGQFVRAPIFPYELAKAEVDSFITVSTRATRTALNRSHNEVQSFSMCEDDSTAVLNNLHFSLQGASADLSNGSFLMGLRKRQP